MLLLETAYRLPLEHGKVATLSASSGACYSPFSYRLSMVKLQHSRATQGDCV